MISTQIIGLTLSLLLAAFFSCAEIAFIASNKLYIEFQSRKGIFSGKLLSQFVKDPSGFVGTVLIGNTLALVIFSFFAAEISYPLLLPVLPELLSHQALVLIIQVSIGCLAFVMVAEFLPKVVFLINPDRLLQILSVPMRVFYVVLYPMVVLVARLSRWVVTVILRQPYPESNPVFNLTDLNEFLNVNADTERDREEPAVDANIFQKALNFKTVRVRQCMVPRTEISAVDVNDTITDLKAAFVESGHSKILVYRDTIDNIIGYCHAIELFKKPKSIHSILSPIMIVAETTLVSDMIIRFTTERKSLALVVDEYGGTSGLISLEDIMEQIFGEIQDEYDQSEDWVEEQLDEHTFLFSARHDVRYLNEKYDLELPEGDYDTLGGLILAEHEDIPEVNNHIEVPPFEFTIIAMQETRIDVVKLVVGNGESRRK